MDNLKQEEFARFLAALDSDQNRAAEKYELLRRKLARVFERRQCRHIEELADEAIDRVIRRLGAERIQDIALFAYGVARNLCLEVARKESRFVSLQDHHECEEIGIGDPDPEESIITELGAAKSRECLSTCLKSLSPGQRELILEYYQGEKQIRIRKRKELAGRQGISIESVRAQANQVRDKLRSCVTRCLNRKRQYGSNARLAPPPIVKGETR